MGHAAENVGLTVERVLKELEKIAFANLADYVNANDDEPKVALAGLSPEKMAAVAEFTTETMGDRSKVKIKLWDKRGALVDIGRHLGMFVDKAEITAKDFKVQVIKDISLVLARRVRKLEFLMAPAPGHWRARS